MSIYALPIPTESYLGTMVYDNFFSEEEITRLLTKYQGVNKWKGAVVSKFQDEVVPNINEEVRRVEINTVHVEEDNMWLFDKLNLAIQDANKHYKFDITGFMEHTQLLYYTFNEGDQTGGFYHWHTDTGVGSLATRKLTCIIQLTDPEEYTGCDVELMGWGSVSKKKGTLTVFPSFNHHRVTELTSGHRESLVCWVNGHPFR